MDHPRPRIPSLPVSPAAKNCNHGTLAVLVGHGPPELSPLLDNHGKASLPPLRQLRSTRRLPQVQNRPTTLSVSGAMAVPNFRASLPSSPVPNGYWSSHRETPRAIHTRQRSSLSAQPQQIQRQPPSNSPVVPTLARRPSIDRRRNSYEPRVSQQSSRASFSTGLAGSPARSLASSRTSYESAVYPADKPEVTQRLGLHTRAVSWDPKYNGTVQVYGRAQRPPAQARPQRQSAPAIPVRRFPRIKSVPGEAFRKLPKAVFDLILDNLRDLHLGEDTGGWKTCTTCWMRDLCSIAQVNRQCFRSAQWKLYGRIWLVGPDSPSQLKKYRLKSGTRLRLLRKSLRANPKLASLVRELKVPDALISSTKEEFDNYLDLVATVIMACPNLEKVVGLYQVPYDHQYSKLYHALASRPRLTEHMWDIKTAPVQLLHHQMGISTTDTDESYQGGEARLSYEQSKAFVDNHTNWRRLSSLVIHCSPGGTVDASTLGEAIYQLPSLLNLSLSNLPRLPPKMLTELPPLSSLHLSNLPALTSQAISSWATSTQATTLHTLTLSHVPLNSLPVLARLLSNLVSLECFTLIQDLPPDLPIGTSIYLHPYLASASLQHITWDILRPYSEPSSDATQILASAISSGGFPALRTIRAPCDYDGTIQALCKPRHQIAEPLDTPLAQKQDSWNGKERKDSGIDGMQERHSFGLGNGKGFATRSLRHARITAQGRIDRARLRSRYKIVVEEWTNARSPTPVAVFDVGGFYGRVGFNSTVEYILTEDVPGKDKVGVCVEDLIAAKERPVLVNVANGHAIGNRCDGRWNERLGKGGGSMGLSMSLALAMGKKEKKRGWEHVEREQWRPMEMRRLF